jgi:MFS family permease
VHSASVGWWLVLFATIYSISSALTSPAWGSIMAEVVPEHLRGRYFSFRGSLSTLSNTIAFLAGGIFLTFLVHKALWGFAILFGAAFLARMISSGLLTQLYEVPQKEKPVQQASSGSFIRNLFSSNLGRYMLFLFSMSFAVNIASPYFAVYQLHSLKQSYFVFAALGTRCRPHRQPQSAADDVLPDSVSAVVLAFFEKSGLSGHCAGVLRPGLGRL